MDATVRERMERLARFVAGDRPRALFAVDAPPPAPGEVPDDLRQPLGRVIQDGELQLKRQLWENERRLRLGGDEDWTPVLQPYLGTGVLASAFGAPTHFSEDQDPWTRPFITSPDEALALARPRSDAALLGEVLRRTRRMRQAAGPDYPIAVTDIQSPLDTALLMWEQSDFFMSMILAPKAVHHVLGLVTDLAIEFVERQREAAGAAFSPLHWPRFAWPAGTGLGVSDDVLPLVGPRQYEEFSLPYLERLGEAFGGLMVHSCGRFAQNLGLLARLESLRMLNFGASEQPIGEAAAALPAGVILCPHPGLNKDIHFDTTAEYVEHVFREMDDPRRLYLVAWPVEAQGYDRGAVLARVRALAG